MAGKSRYAIIGAIIIAIVVVCGLAWKFRPPARTQKMPDGTVLRLERISFGKQDTQYRPLTLREKARGLLARALPPALKKKFLPTPPPRLGGWWTSGTPNSIHTNIDALQLWFTRRDAANGLTNVGVFRGVIIDETGCEFPSTQSGGNYAASASPRSPASSRNGPDSTCNWLTFEAFPRHEKRFRLRLLSQLGVPLADLVVENPAPRSKPANWPTRPVPMSNIQGGITFALTSVRSQPTTSLAETVAKMILPAAGQIYHPPRGILPQLEVRESGEISKEWRPESIELWDTSGNCMTQAPGAQSSLFLSPREPAWKLVVKYFGSEHAASASNAITKLTGVKVPAPGEFITLDSDLAVGAAFVHPISLGGPGQVVYSNNLPIGASQLSGRAAGYDSLSYTNIGFTQLMLLSSSLPQLAFRLGTLTGDQRLTVRAVDGQGREYYAQDWTYGSSSRPQNAGDLHYLDPSRMPGGRAIGYVTLPLPPEVTNVDLYFCIHNAHTEEFIFKPPTNQ